MAETCAHSETRLDATEGSAPFGGDALRIRRCVECAAYQVVGEEDLGWRREAPLRQAARFVEKWKKGLVDPAGFVIGEAAWVDPAVFAHDADEPPSLDEQIRLEVEQWSDERRQRTYEYLNRLGHRMR